MSDQARKELLSEIEKLEKTKLKKINKIIKKIEERQYEKALLLACEHCKAGDKLMLRLIKLICHYKDKLNININYTHAGMSALGYAALNANMELFMALELAGADLSNPKECKNSALVFNTTLEKIKKEIRTLYKSEFLSEYEELNHYFADSSKLPKREEVATDSLNANYDLNRIDFIIKSLNFISKYKQVHTRLQQSPRNLKASDYSVMEIEQIAKCRLLLEKMCVTIHNLSYELRRKYSLHFGPSPFTWMTFDQFGGLVKEPPLDQFVIIPIGDLLLSAPDITPYLPAIKSAEHVLCELEDQQEIIEEAIRDFVDRDLPLLTKFFQDVAAEIQRPTPNIIKPISLFSIKAITSYISDLDNLINLLNLVNYTVKFNPRNSAFSNSKVILNPLSGSRERQYECRFNLTTTRGQHAALRLLERIGELITGKNFSQYLCKLDNTIDWRAFIAIRDGIVHQDAGDNMYQIKKLLNDLPLFEKIVGEDFSEFCTRLVNLLMLREQKLGAYRYQVKEFWSRIIQVDAENKPDEDHEQTLTVIQIERRVSEDDEMIFINALREKAAPQSVIEDCQAIFSGIRAIPDKKEVGHLLSHLPSRAENKERYKQLAAIMTNAIKKPSTTAEERIKKREQEQEARERRELERQQQLKGLNHIREFAARLHKSSERQHLLNPKKRVQAAFDALLNIKQFLVEDKYIIANLPYQTIQQWDAYHLTHSSLSLSQRLEANPELNDAIEYNAAQFLQHLDTIREYSAAAKCQRILNSYGELRRFRNYLEHGNPLYDHQAYQPENIFGHPDHRQKLTAPMFIKLIYEVLPEFQKVVEEFTTDCHLNPLVTEAEMEEWTLVCKRTYPANGFFKADTSQSAKKESPLEMNSPHLYRSY
ncbi:ribonuclease HepT family protein [Legionella clemsonensis]|uniref:WH2 domain-containing protein n=1 Tax=Legionella clemsonensis TaxID=1867846 RepID=A0A222P4C9_9GAMM|nr:hypothetical protein [Legionella clemsonensis]ASQ46677.1 hypothetical protein clem_10655 [Legionella clemsonensis]